MENLTNDIGFLAVTVRTSNGALPIENAMVSIYENRENGENGNDITSRFFVCGCLFCLINFLH